MYMRVDVLYIYVCTCIALCLDRAEAAFHGQFPAADVNGRKLTRERGQRAGKSIRGAPYALTEVRADWKYHVECFRWKRWYKAKAICFCCNASTKGPDVTLSYSSCAQSLCTIRVYM